MTDLHIHTASSDGTVTAQELPSLAHSVGIGTLAITDHDTVEGIDAAIGGLVKGQRLIPGVEMSCRAEEGGFKCHILGLGIDHRHAEIKKLIDNALMQRRGRLSARLQFLKREFGVVLSDGSREELYSIPNAGKLHIANRMIKDGYVGSVEEAMVKYLRAARIPEGGLMAERAIAAIRAAGGAAVWAHPLGGEGDRHISEDELRGRVKKLTAKGIQGMECYYSRYSPEEEQLLLSVAGELGLYVSGGSDFHGENKSVELGALSSRGDRHSYADLYLPKEIRYYEI